MNNWKYEAGEECARLADDLSIVRFGTAGVALLTWVSKETAPSSIQIRGSIICPACQNTSSYKLECETQYNLFSGPKVTCSTCSSRVDLSVWAKKNDGIQRIFVTATLFSAAVGTTPPLPGITISSITDTVTSSTEITSAEKSIAADARQTPEPAPVAYETSNIFLGMKADIAAREYIRRLGLPSVAESISSGEARKKLGDQYVRTALAVLKDKGVIKNESLSGVKPSAGLDTSTDLEIALYGKCRGKTLKISASDYIFLKELFKAQPQPSGCFIATACYGSQEHPCVDDFRKFRDRSLNSSSLGLCVVNWYYKLSPPIANYLQRHPRLASIVRKGVLSPLHSLLVKRCGDRTYM